MIAIDVPHHVTQRGNARRYILDRDSDRMVYLSLLREYVDLYGLSVLGYCLMSNHVHLVVIPRKATSLALVFKQTPGRYASYWNAGHKSSGHAWQGRFYSCPLDESHLWTALRYAERNPVRAGLVEAAEQWRWSSAGVHCGLTANDGLLELVRWRARWDSSSWRKYLAEIPGGEGLGGGTRSPAPVHAYRQATGNSRVHTGDGGDHTALPNSPEARSAEQDRGRQARGSCF